MKTNTTLKKYIESVGGYKNFLKIIDNLVAESTVRMWVLGERKPYILTCLDIEKATKGSLTKEILRPDVFKKIA